MAGHFPFLGNVNRVSVFAFYEKQGLGPELQEAYYRWWFDWARERTLADPDLAAFKGTEFGHFPFGQHAAHDFHLHQYQWSTALLDLGQYIANAILPKLSEHALHELEAKHEAMLAGLRAQAAAKPRAPVPDVGYFRHT